MGSPEDYGTVAYIIILIILFPFYGFAIYILGALIAIPASPLATLITAATAKRKGLDVRVYTLVGTFLFISGVLPWIYMMLKIYNRGISKKWIRIAYVHLYLVWIVVFIGLGLSIFEFRSTIDTITSLDAGGVAVWLLPEPLDAVHMYVATSANWFCISGFFASIVRFWWIRRKFSLDSGQSEHVAMGIEKAIPNFEYVMPFTSVTIWIVLMMPELRSVDFITFISDVQYVNACLITYPMGVLATLAAFVYLLYRSIINIRNRLWNRSNYTEQST